MPETADGERHRQAREPRPPSGQRQPPGERREDVVAQPGRERDVPALPELGYALGEVRPIEVTLNPDPQQRTVADRDVRIAAEVGVKLNGEEKDPTRQFRGGIAMGSCEHARRY